MRSREEDEKLQRSTKKVKESHCLGGLQDNPPPPTLTRRVGGLHTRRDSLEK